jgi:hypothetical protein
MTTYFKILLVAAAFFTVYACSRENETAGSDTLVTKPEAIASNNNKSGGVYKGVLIGSSGVVKIILQGNTIVAEVTVDDVTKTLNPQNLPGGWTSGQALNEIVFSGDNWTLIFSVNDNGTNPQISSVSIPGHENVAVYVVKESSTTLVKAYEGTFGYDTSSSGVGTWNFVTGQQDSLFGIARYSFVDTVYQFIGSIQTIPVDTLSLFSYYPYNSNVISAGHMVGDDEWEGSWNQTGPAVRGGRWKAKRTL